MDVSLGELVPWLAGGQNFGNRAVFWREEDAFRWDLWDNFGVNAKSFEAEHRRKKLTEGTCTVHLTA
eukprot:1160198-Pelagomonas_calceolata.AAC.6